MLEPLIPVVIPVVTYGCDLANPKRQEDPENPIWLHKKGCAFWTPEQEWHAH